jgi:hypothetical protein
MAIIYSYPLNLNILDTDVIIGTSTRLVNGRPKNQTKSFKIEDLANYFIPTLNQVLQVGNVSQLDAKIGELYLYDDPVGGYAKMSVSDNVFMLDSGGGVTILTIDNGNNLVLNNGVAAAQIINPLTTSRNYTLPDKSGTFALTTDIPTNIPTLQQVVDIGNSINLAVDDTEAIIINMVAAPTVNQKGIKVNMPTQTGVPFARGDCFVATINGQNPGTLPNYVSGFYTIVQSGADNYSFSSQHDSAVIAPSRHFSANNSPSATSDFASFNANDVEVFNIDYLGNATANTLSVYDGPNGEYCKIAINDGYFTISRPDGAFTPMLSTENGDNLILTNSNGAAAQIINNLLVSRSYTLPNASGTFALTSDLTAPTLQLVTDSGDTTSNDITANSFIKSSGTSDQILLADGSTSSLAAKANLDSPTFTGTVVLPSTTSIGNVSAVEIGYLDNVTSSIQTQLDSTVKVIINEFPNTSVTGFTAAEATLLTITIPANTFTSPSMPNIKIRMFKQNDAGTSTIRLKTSTSISGVATATIIGLYQMAIAVDVVTLVRNPVINSGFLRVAAGTSTFLSDEATFGGTETSVAFNPAITNYFFITAENTTALDTTTVTTLRAVKIIN